MIVRWPDTNQCDATMIEARAYSTSESGFARIPRLRRLAVVYYGGGLTARAKSFGDLRT
jgi:hypothetical protein